MKFVGYLLLSTVLVFMFIVLGWWTRVIQELWDALADSQKGFVLMAYTVGLVGIILGLTALFLS